MIQRIIEVDWIKRLIFWYKCRKHRLLFIAKIMPALKYRSGSLVEITCQPVYEVTLLTRPASSHHNENGKHRQNVKVRFYEKYMHIQL